MGIKIDIDDLRKVKGIGEKTLERIIEELQPKESLKPSGKVYTPTIVGNNTLYHGDALDVMFHIPDKSVSLVLADIPYGTTACKWDSVIPFEPMWEHLNRIIKTNGVIVLFGSEPFSSALRMSNINMYKYDWKWKKTKAIGFQHAKNKPMKILEDIIVFSQSPMGHKSMLGERRMVYQPQGVVEVGEKTVSSSWHGNMMGARPNQVGKKYVAYTGYPNELLEYSQPIGVKSIHPTQKPVMLMEYLIHTYTKEDENVLDFTMGSGTTLVACAKTNRKGIGIEMDDKYFEIAKNRLKST